MTVELVIAPRARRQGVEDQDMLHAYRNAIDARFHEERLVMPLGPTGRAVVALGRCRPCRGRDASHRSRHEGETEVSEMRMPRRVKEIIEQAEELARRFEGFEPDPRDRVRAVRSAPVHRAALARAKAEATLVDAVTKARADGHSWSALGAVLGTSSDAARQRDGQWDRRRPKAV
jgi:hypothetical protein